MFEMASKARQTVSATLATTTAADCSSMHS